VHSKSKTRRLVLLVLILLSVSLSGCSTAVKLYPITDTDIYVKENGDVCMSEYYMKEVLDAKIQGK
jgi:uncharacterized protein YceK